MSALTFRAIRALRHPANWIQLGKFGVVGAIGYGVNLGLYAALLGLGAHTAALLSFIASAAGNYALNRAWTFADQKGHFGIQGMRYLVVTVLALGLNQLWLLLFLDVLGLHKLGAQALSIALIVPVNFLGNKLWSFR